MNGYDAAGIARHAVDKPVFRVTENGDIETLVSLDRETVSSYLLKVGVHDRGERPLGSTALVRVDILDVNDNAPEWIFPATTDRTINLTTAMKPGSLIGQLRAEDIDEGASGIVHHMLLGPNGEPLKGVSLEEGLLRDLQVKTEQNNQALKDSTVAKPTSMDLNGYRMGSLYLNGSTGEIWVAQALVPGTINLHLRAFDQGKPHMFADNWLTINVFVDPSEGSGLFGFGGDGTLNVTIILIMITITAVVSLFLITGIICVKRRPIWYPNSRIPEAIDGAASPGNATTTFSMDTNKEYIACAMNPSGWPTMGMYPSGQLVSHTGGTPIMDDCQLFSTMGGPGMMGYGAMINQSDTGSMIYIPQRAPPSNSSGPAGGSLTPVPGDLNPCSSDYPSRNQLHTFGVSLLFLWADTICLDDR